MRSTVLCRVWVALRRASSLMVFLAKYSITNREAIRSNVMAVTTIRLKRIDKVLLMNLQKCRISVANIEKNHQTTLLYIQKEC